MRVIVTNLLILLAIICNAQQQQTFITPLCWRVSPSLDSTIHRIELVSASAMGVYEVGYINNNGVPITLPASQQLLNGACECCYGKFPPTQDNPTPSVDVTSVSQPTFNPFNPTLCGSTCSFQTVNVTNIADITVTLDGNPVPFSWDSMTGQGIASVAQTINSGLHIFVVTITTANCGPCTDSGDFDCG